jgi:hypothetical protein
MTRKQAFDTAMRELRKNGVIAKRNVQGCCRSCITIDTDGKPLVWHYGGQGNSFTWRNDEPVPTYTPTWQNEETLEGIYLNHSGLVAESGEMTKAGQLVVDTFTRHGFGVEWDGTNSECVWVAF